MTSVKPFFCCRTMDPLKQKPSNRDFFRAKVSRFWAQIGIQSRIATLFTTKCRDS
jgi:hypothetical protein